MKTISFSASELSVILLAMDYMDCCLENLPVSPEGWTEERSCAAFISAQEKYASGASPFALTDDEIVMTDTVLYHYLFTAQPFDMPRIPPEDAAEAAAIRTRIESLVSDARLSGGSSR